MWHAYVNYKHKVGRAEVQLALVTQILSGCGTDCLRPVGYDAHGAEVWLFYGLPTVMGSIGNLVICDTSALPVCLV